MCGAGVPFLRTGLACWDKAVCLLIWSPMAFCRCLGLCSASFAHLKLRCELVLSGWLEEDMLLHVELVEGAFEKAS